MFDTEVENMFQQFTRVKPLCLCLKVKLSIVQPSMFISSNVIKS